MDKTYNSAERQPIIEEMEQLLSELKRHVKYLREANKNLKKIEADMEKMEKYYMSDWIDDYENFRATNPMKSYGKTRFTTKCKIFILRK